VVSDVEVAMALWRMSGLDRVITFRKQTTSMWVTEGISTWFGREEILLALFVFPFSCC